MEKRQIKKGSPYPLGVSIVGKNVNFSMVDHACRNSGIILYHKQTAEEAMRIPFDKKNKMGNISCLLVENININEYDYNFYIDDNICVDPYARQVIGNEVWDEDTSGKVIRGSLYHRKFNWQDTKPLCIPYSDSILYCMHVRGFTKHASSKVKHKGTFLGIKEKIPYLKSLGITAIELMPSYEFNERAVEKEPQTMEYAVAHLGDTPPEENTHKINYWGYQDAFYFSPKASYAAGKDAVYELKLLIRELHKQGIEVIMQFYFPDSYQQSYILDVIKYWVMEYQIDGVHLKGSKIPVTLLATEPLLARTKILYCGFSMKDIYPDEKQPEFINLAYYRDDFMYDMRKFLKSDMDMLPSVQFHMRNHPQNAACINYITNYYGFTLNDLVSYDRKHNEMNGEDNHDGTDYNYSWNCGIEGDTKKKSILAMRRKQVRNALAFVLLSQGTPLLLAGDEFGNSQMGNNNPYCQDNEITWLNWKRTKAARELFQYTKYLIALRKEHPILHRNEAMRMMDSIGCGYPDLSYHSQEAWRVHLENYNRHIAMLYCGKYVKKNRKYDDFFYIALNMHWEKKEFALPKLPNKYGWKLVLDTVADVPDEENLPEITDDRKIVVEGRSIRVLESYRMK